MKAAPQTAGETEARSGPVRPNGILVLLGIIVLGLGTGAGYYAYKRPRLERERAAALAGAPTTLEGRLERWLAFGAPQIHHRLSRFARFSAEWPWLVTHRVAAADGGLATVWGIDCQTLPQGLAHLEGTTVVVELPAPGPLGRVELDPVQSRFVPSYPSEAAVPDPAARLVDLATFFLERLPQALEREIPGARLEIRVLPPAPAADR